MEITKQTLAILKNFSTINTGICFTPGSTLRTITPLPTILAKAELDTVVEEEFCIGDLPGFLRTLSLVKTPRLDITSERVIIRDMGVEIRHVCDKKSLITLPPDTFPDLPPTLVKFVLTQDMLKSIINANSVMGMKHIAIIGDGKKLIIKSIDLDGKTDNYYSVDVSDTKKTCSVILATDNLKILPGDYMVTIANKGKHGISKFQGIDVTLEYFIAVSTKSRYE